MDIILFLLFALVVFLIALGRTRKLKRESATRGELAELALRVRELEGNLERLQGVLAKATTAEAAQPWRVIGETVQREIQPAILPPQRVVAKLQDVVQTKPAPMPPVPTLTKPATSPHVPPSPVPRSRRLADLEERLGANWLNKIGTAVLVIGVAFFLNYTMRALGPAGKIAVGYALSAALLILGVVGERRDRYRVAARAVLGGGWAIAYSTTYAMHNVAAVRVVENAFWGFTLLFAVAAAMVAHSLRYNSQLTTGFAYMLGFASVAGSRMSVETLVASAALATSLAIVFWRRRWYALEPLAILATYIVHWLWLGQVFGRLGGHKPFPEFKASAVLLTYYWALWMASYFLRDEGEKTARKLLIASFLLNAGGYLAVLHYQSLYPHLRFGFLLSAGTVYLVLSWVARRRTRRLGFVLASTFGASLLAAAIPYRYAGAPMELLWLAQAEAFLVAGLRLAEAHLRKLGWAAAGALSVYVLFHDLSLRLEFWRPPNVPLGCMLLTLSAAFYLNAWLAPRLLRSQASETDRASATSSYAVATGWFLAAAWLALPFMWVGVAWAVVAVALREFGRRGKDTVLRGCGDGAALLAVVRLLVVNIQYPWLQPGINPRLVTVALGAALFYLSAQRIAQTRARHEGGTSIVRLFVRYGGLPACYSWGATLLAALLIWSEVTNAAVGLGWALLGLALLETGRTLTNRPLLAQGYTLLALSFLRIFIADLNATQRIGQISARLITVSLLAAIYYCAAFTVRDAMPRMRSALFWFGAGALAALARFELATAWVAVAWAGLALACYVAGKRQGIPAMRYQAYVLTLLVGMRCAFDNFYQVGTWAFTNTRVATVSAAAALLYVLLGMALAEKRRQRPAAQTSTGVWGRRARLLEDNSQLLFFFVPMVLLTVLLSLEVRRSYLTAAWGLEAAAVFALTLRLGERSFRWFALGLLLLCVGRIVSVDV